VKKRWKLWTAVALTLLVSIVVLQNTEPVTTEILWITVRMPLVLLLVTTLLAGVAIGLLISHRFRGK